ncbi:MAG: DotU family type IV/VI secretion system protein [Acidobacteriia bacterium]|jgi:type VI secretion system protein ImpK|nr:DotU family type IV/VI secretion system protein [Terriglobia bacterium]
MTPSAVAHRTENLALVLQEVLTAIVRLRSNRQAVSDAGSFRIHMREALKSADQEARKLGYSGDIVQIATFAVVAFLDESILNSRNPMFADWPRKPLQEELFGTHMAGEVFFQNLQKLLGQTDSPEVADALEVYYLCVLLGFGGKYSAGNKGDLRAIMDAVADKIHRMRGRSVELSPSWMLPKEAARRAGGDPWVRNLGIAAIGCAGLALVLFLFFFWSLGSGVGDLRALAAQGR